MEAGDKWIFEIPGLREYRDLSKSQNKKVWEYKALLS